MAPAVSHALRAISLIGELPLAVLRVLDRSANFPMRDFRRIAAQCSAQALPIVAVVNLLLGSILAFVGAVQLIQFGAGMYVADLVGVAVPRELAAAMTAIVMAGRTGADFAAELATMQSNEEVDALEVLGLDAISYLVLPRVLALTLMMPVLYLYGSVFGLLGGLLVGSDLLDISYAAYFERTVAALSYTQFALGASKSLFFGALVGLTGCYFGLHASRNAAGIGAAATSAVVIGIVGVIVVDTIFAVCANSLGV
jgi:phospholipid/cholesterol/gamma-HCH transport system permease protein